MTQAEEFGMIRRTVRDSLGYFTFLHDGVEDARDAEDCEERVNQCHHEYVPSSITTLSGKAGHAANS